MVRRHWEFLLEFGASRELLDGIELGLRTEDWGPAIRAFANVSKPSREHFYVGPLRFRRSRRTVLGVLFLADKVDARVATERIYPLLANARRLVYGDGGPAFVPDMEFLAGLCIGHPEWRFGTDFGFFVPQYLLNDPVSVPLEHPRRRLVLVESLVAKHHRRLDAIGGIAAMRRIPEGAEREGITLSAVLAARTLTHEAAHGWGSLPLLGSGGGKGELGKSVAALEEWRVDLVSWLAWDGPPLGLLDLAEDVRLSIILNRIGAVAAELVTNNRLSTISAEVGGYWLDVIGGVTSPLTRRPVKDLLESPRLRGAIIEELGVIHVVEDRIRSSSSGLDSLVAMAERLRDRHLVNTSVGAVPTLRATRALAALAAE